MTKKTIEKKDTSAISCRVLEYVQYLPYIKDNGLPTTIKEMAEFVAKNIDCEEWAMIIHDACLKVDGEPKDAHFHIIMRFATPRTPKSVAKKFNDMPQYIEAWNNNKSKKEYDEKADKNNWLNGLSYLCHRNYNSKKLGKHQYDPLNVYSSLKTKDGSTIPYPDKLAEITATFDRKTKDKTDSSNEKMPNSLKAILDGYRAGMFSYDLVILMTQPHQRKPTFMSHLNSLTKEMLEEKYKTFKTKMIESKQSIKTIFCFGKTACGKSKWAKEYAAKNFDEYYIGGSNRDIFAGYRGAPICVLDEIRPDNITYNELLKLLDPWNFENVVGSRYFDKKLIAEEIIITTPYNPLEFYARVKTKKGEDITILLDESGHPVDVQLNEIDSPDQFFRRLGLVLEFTKESVIPHYYNSENKRYESIEEEKFPNAWSSDIPFKTKSDTSSDFKRLMTPNNLEKEKLNEQFMDTENTSSIEEKAIGFTE